MTLVRLSTGSTFSSIISSSSSSIFDTGAVKLAQNLVFMVCAFLVGLFPVVRVAVGGGGTATDSVCVLLGVKSFPAADLALDIERFFFSLASISDAEGVASARFTLFSRGFLSQRFVV